MLVTLHIATSLRTVADMNGGKERDDTVVLVVIDYRPRTAPLQRKPRLDPAQCLDHCKFLLELYGLPTSDHRWFNRKRC
jgi:hypothetical protein